MGCGKSSAKANDPTEGKGIVSEEENEPTKQSNFELRDEDDEAVIEDQGKGVVEEEHEEDIILTNVASPEHRISEKKPESTSPSGL